jgi:hypothetical protein
MKKLPEGFKPKKEVVLEVTAEEYESNRAKGVPDELNLNPGRHVFTRGRFDLPKGAFDSKNIKVRITINVDSDVLNHFKERAKQPDAAPYQTQINNALRRAMDAETAGSNVPSGATGERLVRDKGFIKAVAKEVRKELAR